VGLAKLRRQESPIGGMQATLLLLCQYRLSHLQVCLLKANKALVFLQHLVEVGLLLGPRARDTRLGEEVLLDSVSSNAIVITFRVHLSLGALKGRQSILPHGDGTFPAIHLPLPGKEQPQPLDDHCI
jgi:hypothetical protein